jgi:hypothetical protein
MWRRNSAWAASDNAVVGMNTSGAYHTAGPPGGECQPIPQPTPGQCLWGHRPDGSGLDPRHPGTVSSASQYRPKSPFAPRKYATKATFAERKRKATMWSIVRRSSRSGSDRRPFPEARTGSPGHADRTDSGGSGENSGNAGCKGPYLPWPIAAARPVGGPSPTPPREPDINVQFPPSASLHPCHSIPLRYSPNNRHNRINRQEILPSASRTRY